MNYFKFVLYFFKYFNGQIFQTQKKHVFTSLILSFLISAPCSAAVVIFLSEALYLTAVNIYLVSSIADLFSTGITLLCNMAAALFIINCPVAIAYISISMGQIIKSLASVCCLSVCRGAGHFGHRTLRHRDTSAPQNWCRTLRRITGRTVSQRNIVLGRSVPAFPRSRHLCRSVSYYVYGVEVS